MGRITDCENVWFRARKKAASYNDKLNSREGASEAIGIAPSTLAEYELGITKCIPPDKAVLMADVYKAPELMSWYCNHECPIGCATAKKPEEVGGIEQVAIALLNGLSLDDLAAIRQSRLTILQPSDRRSLKLHVMARLMTTNRPNLKKSFRVSIRQGLLLPD